VCRCVCVCMSHIYVCVRERAHPPCLHQPSHPSPACSSSSLPPSLFYSSAALILCPHPRALTPMLLRPCPQPPLFSSSLPPPAAARVLRDGRRFPSAPHPPRLPRRRRRHRRRPSRGADHGRGAGVEQGARVAGDRGRQVGTAKELLLKALARIREFFRQARS
jgi:hypothetical protein